jgi:mRNA-degrading endonuclease RelE of RelBE toxin-antitoxin system
LAEQGMPVISVILKLFKNFQYKNFPKTDSKRLKEFAIQNLEKVEKTLLTFDKELTYMNGEQVHKLKVSGKYRLIGSCNWRTIEGEKGMI